MRKIKIMEHISLDGVIEQGQDYAYGDWTNPYRSPAGLEFVLEAQGSVFDLLLGRKTYDLWSGYWPKAGNMPIANSINAATKYIATHRPESLNWGPVADLGSDIVEGIRSLKLTAGPDIIVWGSSTLTSLLLDHGLADEVVLIVYPVLLGRGKKLFSDHIDARELTFISSKVTPTGLLMNTYRHVGPLKK
ncbi:dihydrofolate reductase family protein [Dyadobacter psychrotolerans]|uniref:Dihydrofolate reductase n=1 Tax=Dyadobacter psychrotolerans TaxID=2541721 RepID=A0A4R5DUY5_9BACT|nr:dihydrofolate reductase family protein [Dyadobacter psychrotolerans]TDE14803.1 dihydrofolate reductase [Dyadobacter psychrotolerans]